MEPEEEEEEEELVIWFFGGFTLEAPPSFPGNLKAQSTVIVARG